MSNIKILFVCMGNICRSPTAEGVFRSLVEKEKRLTNIYIDSCGTIAYHVGESPDKRSSKAAKIRGYDLSSIRARKIENDDFFTFDYILAMDTENLNNINLMKEHLKENSHEKEWDKIAEVSLFLDYASVDSVNVPDPYYGGASGFEDVLDLIEDASRGLISHLLASKD